MTAASNPRLRAVRALHRRRGRERADAFLAEGEDLVAEATAAGAAPHELLVAAGCGLEGTAVAPELLAAASTLGSGTRAIGVYPRRAIVPAAGVLRARPDAPGPPLLIHLHGVRDPGNVGTVLRAAHALGAAGVSLGPGTADPHGPKAVRASMGAIFRVVLAHTDDPAALPARTVALDAAAPGPLRGPATEPTVLVVGAERDGLSAALRDACDERARLPMVAFDSLNAAMAATIGLYELRRDAPGPGPVDPDAHGP